MIKSDQFTFKSFNFPVGEKHVRIDYEHVSGPVSVTFEFEKNEDIIELLLVCDALKQSKVHIRQLIIPYVPFSRQDRVAVPGECFSLKVFAKLINDLDIPKIIVIDPHSDVLVALINNCVVIKQWEVFLPILSKEEDFWLVSPDAGALKKTYELASKLRPTSYFGVIECSKKRNVIDGKITGVKVNGPGLKDQNCIIVDDIADGGRTFIEVAKALKRKHCSKIILCVTHGFFTKGISVFDGLIDEIYTRKGQVK